MSSVTIPIDETTQVECNKEEIINNNKYLNKNTEVALDDKTEESELLK